MARPFDLKTKIFLDGGDPHETKEIVDLLGFLDGQTTNPTLISKNPDAQKRLEEGRKFTHEEIMSFYRNVVKEISEIIPQGSVSVEVYADRNGITADAMFKQGKEMFSWIPNAHIKYPITQEGLVAAQYSIQEHIRINMTLCFAQEQAAAVYGATRGAKKGDVFVSPFVGRIDDKGENGMDLIKHIVGMYKNGDGHVEVLAASVRNFNHFLCAIQIGADIITAPLKILKEWAEKKMPIPKGDFLYPSDNLCMIPYREIDITRRWQEFDIASELTDNGIDRFSEDWNKLIMAI